MAKMPKTLQKYSVMQLILFAVILLSIAAVGLMGKQLADTQAYFNFEYAKNQMLYQSLQTEIESYGMSVDGALGSDVTVIQAKVYNATAAGVDVANYQTAFTDCYAAADKTTALQKNMLALQPYFDNEAKLPDGGIAGYMPWFIDSRKGEVPKWEFKTTYSFSSDLMPVLWECRNGQGELLAFCYGNYVSETGLLRDTKVMLTTIGSEFGQPCDDTPGPDVIQNGLGITGYDPSNPDTLPDGYTLNDDGTITDPSGNVMSGAGFDDGQMTTDMWDGTPSGSSSFRDEVGDMLDQRQQGLQNGPPQSEIDANKELQTGGYTGDSSDELGGYRGSDGTTMNEDGVRDPSKTGGDQQ